MHVANVTKNDDHPTLWLECHSKRGDFATRARPGGASAATVSQRPRVPSSTGQRLEGLAAPFLPIPACVGQVRDGVFGWSPQAGSPKSHP